MRWAIRVAALLALLCAAAPVPTPNSPVDTDVVFFPLYWLGTVGVIVLLRRLARRIPDQHLVDANIALWGLASLPIMIALAPVIGVFSFFGSLVGLTVASVAMLSVFLKFREFLNAAAVAACEGDEAHL